MAQSGPGKIRIFNDFCGPSSYLALTAGTGPLNAFYSGGEGHADGTAGVALNNSLLSGVITLTSGATDADTTFIGTTIGFDAGLMGTIACETRVQMSATTAKEIFFGLTSILTTDEQLEDIVINSSATAVTIVADLAGFYFSNELTASLTDWHGIHGGGSTADGATVANQVLSSPVTVDEWQVLRLETDTNGTCRWYVNGKIKKTVVGAVSTTSNYAVCLAVADNSGAGATAECDYILATANRDWTV